MAQVASAGRHNARTAPAQSADERLRERNRELVPPHPRGLSGAVKERLPAIVRSNAVRAVEVLFSTSRPVADAEAWACASLRWACQRWGVDNVAAATLHNDEPNCPPHLHLVFVPLRSGRLNAKAIIGNRDTLREMQDSYAQAVESFGLQRGRANPCRRNIPPAELRKANLGATEQEQRAAVGQVKILRAEIAALRAQLRAVREACDRAGASRGLGLEKAAQRSRLMELARQPAQDTPRAWRGVSAPAMGLGGGGQEL